MHVTFGDPDKVIIECATKPDRAAKRELWLGLVWLSIGGEIVGNVEERFHEQIGISLGALIGAAQQTGKRNCRLLEDLSPDDALDLVMWAVYGGDEQHPELADADRNLLSKSELLSSIGGPAFDGWEAAIVEADETETIIWRPEKGLAQSRTFPLGTLWAAVEQAQVWLRSDHPQ